MEARRTGLACLEIRVSLTYFHLHAMSSLNESMRSLLKQHSAIKAAKLTLVISICCEHMLSLTPPPTFQARSHVRIFSLSLAVSLSVDLGEVKNYVPRLFKGISA